MLIATVRDKFKSQTAGLTSEWTNEQIDGYLLPIYSEFLPSDIDGKIHEMVWVKTLSPDVNPLVIPSNVISFPTGCFALHGTGGSLTGSPDALQYYENHADFLARWPDYRNAASTGKPQALYRTGRELWFNVYPDTDYNLIVEARGQTNTTLPADIPFNHAMCVVMAAAWQFYLEQGDDESAERAARQYETWKMRVLTDAWGDARERTPNRSY